MNTISNSELTLNISSHGAELHNIIKDNKFNDVFIPELELKSKNFKIIFNFNIIDNG